MTAEWVDCFWPCCNCVDVSFGKIMNLKSIPEEQSLRLAVRVNNKELRANMVACSISSFTEEETATASRLKNKIKTQTHFLDLFFFLNKAFSFNTYCSLSIISFWTIRDGCVWKSTIKSTICWILTPASLAQRTMAWSKSLFFPILLPALNFIFTNSTCY